MGQARPSPAGVQHRRRLPRHLHGVPRRRAGPRRHRIDRAGTAQRRARHGAHAGPGLPLRAAPGRLPHHHSAADERFSRRLQELVARADHRGPGADRPDAADRGIHLPGLRGLYGGHHPLLRRHLHRDDRHAGRRRPHRDPRHDLPGVEIACSPISISRSSSGTYPSCGRGCSSRCC